METLDQNQNENSFPEEALQSIRSMYGWMMFCGVMGIIGGVFGALGGLTTLTVAPAQGVVNLLVSAVGIYVAFQLVKSASSFNKFATTKDSDSLDAALKANYTYWLINCIMVFVNIVLSIAVPKV